MRMGASASSARSPALEPSVTSTWVGAPRRLAGFFCFGSRPRGSGVRAVSGTRAPNMSERITEMAESTKIHSTAR